MNDLPFDGDCKEPQGDLCIAADALRLFYAHCAAKHPILRVPAGVAAADDYAIRVCNYSTGRGSVVVGSAQTSAGGNSCLRLPQQRRVPKLSGRKSEVPEKESVSCEAQHVTCPIEPHDLLDSKR